jgi:hypothetical protein
MNRSYVIALTDVAEGLITSHHGIIEKGRWQFDTYEQALEIIGSLESKGYEAADGATESIKYLLDVQNQYAASQQTGDGEEEAV